MPFFWREAAKCAVLQNGHRPLGLYILFGAGADASSNLIYGLSRGAGWTLTLTGTLAHKVGHQGQASETRIRPL